MAKNWISDQEKTLIQDSVNREQLLEILGVSGLKYKNEQIRCTCPIHRGDNTTSFALFPDNNWVCFSHGCNNSERQDLFSLVMKSRNISFIEAAKFLANLSGIAISFSDPNDKNLIDSARNNAWARHTAAKNLYTKESDLCVDPEIIYSFIQKRHRYLFDRGFNNQTQNDFEIGYCYDWIEFALPSLIGKVAKEPRITFPISFNGRYVGVQARCITGDGKEGKSNNPWPRDKKYDNITGFIKTNFLYNYERAIRYANMTRSIIICEGITDVMKLHQIGIRNVVSTFGASVAVEQVKLLCKGIWEIYIFFDNDEAGNKNFKLFVDEYKSLFNIFKITPPVGKDAATLEPLEIYNLISSAERFV